jgi:peroxiredoxin
MSINTSNGARMAPFAVSFYPENNTVECNTESCNPNYYVFTFSWSVSMTAVIA